MIVAARFGWPAVSSEPMDWIEYHLARQLLAEEGVGRAQRAEVAEEDAAFAALKNTVPRG